MSHVDEEVDRPRRSGWERAFYAVAAILALVPAVRMALLVREAAPLQYSDYWLLLPHFTNSDGSLDVGGLFDFEFQNHPVVVPMVVYWLNVALFAGSNVALGVGVLVLAVGILAMVALVLHRSGFRPVDRMVLLVLASCLVFTPNGTWNYTMAMSGTAWLGAGLLGLVAVYLRSRDKPVLAFGAAAVAVITYATSLMIWPALVAVGACRRPVREWWREWPYVVGFIATFLWYREVQTTGLGADLPWPGFLDTFPLVTRLLAFPLGLEGSAAEAVGYLLLLGIPALVIWFAVVARSDAAAAWVGIAVFGLLATLSLAVGRSFVGAGGQNRYASLPALAWIGFAGLVVLAVRREGRPGGGGPSALGRWAPLASCVVIAVLATTSGAPHVEKMRSQVGDQELRELALHLDIADGTPYLAGYNTSVTELLVGIDHQPFVDGWDLDCGLIDERLASERIDSSEPAGELVSARSLALLGGAAEITGRLPADRPARCVVVTDEANLVIGAATVGVDGVEGTGDGTGATGFVAIARPGAREYRAYAIFEDDPTPVELFAVSLVEL